MIILSKLAEWKFYCCLRHLESFEKILHKSWLSKFSFLRFSSCLVLGLSSNRVIILGWGIRHLVFFKTSYGQFSFLAKNDTRFHIPIAYSSITHECPHFYIKKYPSLVYSKHHLVTSHLIYLGYFQSQIPLD